jgi:3-hydroxyacyl-CoA dehydrogenase
MFATFYDMESVFENASMKSIVFVQIMLHAKHGAVVTSSILHQQLTTLS